jgi:hypothetical protein
LWTYRAATSFLLPDALCPSAPVGGDLGEFVVYATVLAELLQFPQELLRAGSGQLADDWEDAGLRKRAETRLLQPGHAWLALLAGELMTDGDLGKDGRGSFGKVRYVDLEQVLVDRARSDLQLVVTPRSVLDDPS